MPKRVLFLANKCLLDTRSGAAIEIRALLETLLKRGYKCESITASLFDGEKEFPIRSILGNQAFNPEYMGKVFVVQHQGVRHNILRTQSTLLSNFRETDSAVLQEFTRKYLKEFPQDLVISFGGRPLDRALQNAASHGCNKKVFYLANALYVRRHLKGLTRYGARPSFYVTITGINSESSRLSCAPSCPTEVLLIRTRSWRLISKD